MPSSLASFKPERARPRAQQSLKDGLSTFAKTAMKPESNTPPSFTPAPPSNSPNFRSKLFRREDVAHPCQGFGMLIPKVEGFKILGTIFSSSLFPSRAPAGHLTLTSYIGGERYPELASLPHDKLVALACEDLRVLLGVKG